MRHIHHSRTFAIAVGREGEDPAMHAAELESSNPTEPTASSYRPLRRVTGSYVRWPKDIDAAEDGNKAYALSKLVGAGLPVPDFFVVVPKACLDSLGELERAMFIAAPEGKTRACIVANCIMRGRVVHEIRAALAILCPNGEAIAVRSSATGEDSGEHSFAGQLESHLSTAPADALERIAAVWRSGFAERVLAYRIQRGLHSAPSVPAVIVQRMVSATKSGIAFSVDPVSGSPDFALVAAADGLGDALADGAMNGSTWRVDRAGKIESVGTILDAPAQRSILDHEAILLVAALTRRAACLFGSPQDVEWCVLDGRIHLLQSRPITTLGPARRRENATIWDNSNIVENYGGVTMPLTFSFVRQVYDAAYRGLTRELGISPATVASHETLFGNMIGLFKGRIYYNLTNWYRLLALVPGFDTNRRYLDRMLGVRHSAADETISAGSSVDRASRLASALRFAGFAARCARHHFALAWRIRGFRRRFDRILGSFPRDLSRRAPLELTNDYTRLVTALKPHAAVAPLNDFAVMVFGGLAHTLLARYLCARDSTQLSALVCSSERSVTAAISSELRTLAQLAGLDPRFVKRLCEGTLKQIFGEIDRWPEFRNRFEAYITAYGDRGADELKLESPSLRDDPLPLLRAIGYAARAGEAMNNAKRVDVLETRRKAEQHFSLSLRGKPLKRVLLRWTLRHARARGAARENLRFDRARFFARVRQIFAAIGAQLANDQVLDEGRDIFLLELDEIFAFLEGRSTSPNLRHVVAMRKHAWEQFRAATALPERFVTRGMPYGGNSLEQPRESIAKVPRSDALHLQGVGCCPGRARGRVRVVENPRLTALEEGDILVAERTDPGWVILFGAAKGLIVERGNILSHAAIAAREFGLPAIVSVPRVTARLKDGDWIEMDGATGAIVLLPSPQKGDSVHD